MAFADLLTDTMDVYASTWTRAQSGGMKQTTAPKATAQKCRMQTAGANQQALNEALGIKITGELFTNYAGCVNGDVLIVKDSAGTPTATLRVVGTPIQRRPIGNMPGFYVVAFEYVDTGE